jgi:hypothetical protein
MNENSVGDDIRRISAFTASMSSAITRVREFAARLGSLSQVAENAAIQLNNVDVTSARLLAKSQAIATCCQCIDKPANKMKSSASWWGQSVDQFALAAIGIGAAKLYLDAIEYFRTMFRAVLVRGLSAAGKPVVTVLKGILAYPAIEVALDAASTALAAVTSPMGLAIATLLAAVGGVAYFVWRNWNSIAPAVRKIGSIIAVEAKDLVGKISSAAGALFSARSSKTFRRATDPHLTIGSPTRNHASDTRRNLGTADLILIPLSLVSPVPPESVGFRAANAAVRTAAAAMLITPLLMTPANADIASVQPRIKATRTASVVINSSPTITISASNCGDIEQRVLEALRKHREELYSQWCGELQRRQRIQF